MDSFTRSLVEFTLSHKCSRNWLLTVIEWVRLKCDHDEANVVADVLEGSVAGKSVEHCRTCGCVRVSPSEGWRP